MLIWERRSLSSQRKSWHENEYCFQDRDVYWSRLSRKQYEIDPWLGLLWITNRKYMYSIGLYVTLSMTLSDLEMRIFIPRLVPSAIKVGMITHVRQMCVSMGSAITLPIPRCRAPALPNLGELNLKLKCDHTAREVILQGPPPPLVGDRGNTSEGHHVCDPTTIAQTIRLTRAICLR